MQKSDYLRECLKLNPKLRGDILTFHKEFPPVFSCMKGKQVPAWLKPILEPVRGLRDAFGNDLYVGRPRKIDDLKILLHSPLHGEGLRILMIGEGKYWEAVNKKPWEYAEAFSRLCESWPHVDKSTFLHGLIEPRMRPLFLYTASVNPTEEWNQELEHLADKVKIVVPIYSDTSKDDLDWEFIALLQALVYGVKRRSTPGKYELKLRIWNLYQEMKDFAKVSRVVNLPRTTVKSLYESVAKDILGSTPHRTIKERRAEGIDIHSHVAECSRCQNARTIDQMCPIARAYVDQDVKAIRELPVGGQPETYTKAPGRETHPGEEEYFEDEG